MESKKIRLNKSAESMLDFAKEEFSEDGRLSEMKDLFGELSYGSIIIKVVKGEIETVRVVKNYKPLDLTEE